MVMGGGEVYNNSRLGTTALPLDEGVSPVTLSSDWSRVVRLLLVASLAVIGSLGNIYMISAVMIEDHLKKRGNTFVVNVALADLVVTMLIMPISAVVILSGLEAPAGACTVQWFLAILSWLVTVLSLASISAENYARLCLPPEKYACLTTTKVTVCVLGIWIVATIAVTIQHVYDLGPDYCTRKSEGIRPYQAGVAAVFVAMPAFLTVFFYLRTIYNVRLAKAHPSFKPPVAFSWDYSLMKTNMYSFFLFFLFWLPFGVILFVGSIKDISARLFYNLAWFALSKSCVNNLLYCIADRHFRNAYINLFHYCCCKTTVTFSRRTRGEGARPSGDVRVHIIPGYNMYSYTSPQRSRESGPTSKRTAALSRPQSRDVYEL